MWIWLKRLFKKIFFGRPMIKANISAYGEKVYHLPGDTHYNKIVIDFSKGENMFWTITEVEKEGFRRTKT